MTESPGGATVRSVRVRMELDIASYVANSRAVGRESESTADRIERSFTRVSKSERSVSASTSDMNSKLGQTEQVMGRTERSIGRTNNQLDTFSGRTKLILKTVVGIGPALVPLGAGLVPVVAGLTAMGGAAAAGIGVTVLALKGVGDALKALDTYQLEKTPENLAKVREEFARIGPDGERFVRFLDSIEPQLRELQLTARAGALPGFEESITNLLDLLPELKFLIGDLSSTAGDLAADAGASLAGEDFSAFFDYLRTDAAPTLDAFGRIVGNFTLAFANLIVGLAPATRDFTGGLLEFSQGLADASANLDTNRGFQDFLDYVQANGPQALEFISAFGAAFVDFVSAVAPVGAAILPALTAILNVFSALASSPIGPTLIAAAVGFNYLTTAASLAEKTLGKVAPTSTRATSAIAGLKTAGIAAGTVLVLNSALAQLTRAGDDAGPGVQALTRDLLNLNDAAAQKNVTAGLGDLQRSLDVLSDPGLRSDILSLYDSIPFGSDFADVASGVTSFAGAFGDVRKEAREATADLTSLDEALAGIVAQGGTEEAAAALQDLAAAYGLTSSEVDQLVGLLPQYQEALAAADTADQLAASQDGLTAAIADTAAAAESERRALEASTEAMRAKREEALAAFDAETRYGQAVADAARQARQGGKGIDENTKAGRANRQALSDLAGAWNNQSDAIKNSRAQFNDARGTFIDTAVAMGVPRRAARELANELLEIPEQRKVKVEVPTGSAMAGIRAIEAGLDRIADEDVYVRIHRIGTSADINSGGIADGGTVRGKRSPYGDKVFAYLAPGEEVISNRRGQADRARPLLKAINAGRFADGGTAGRAFARSEGFRRGDDAGVTQLFAQVAGAARSLKDRLEEARDAIKDEKDARRDLIQSSKDYAAQIGQGFSKADLFGNGLAGFDLGVEANTNDTRAAEAALKKLKKKGLDGALFDALAASGDLNTLEQFAGLSAAEIAQREKRFAAQASAQASLGGRAADEKFGDQIKEQNKLIRSLESTVKDLKSHLPKAVEDGARRGVGDRNRQTSQRVAVSR